MADAADAAPPSIATLLVGALGPSLSFLTYLMTTIATVTVIVTVSTWHVVAPLRNPSF